MEPRKLWKRYLVTNTQFVTLLMKVLYQGARSGRTGMGPGGTPVHRDNSGVLKRGNS
jgi:hypothetical protein